MCWRSIWLSAHASAIRLALLLVSLLLLFTTSSLGAPIVSAIYDGSWSGTTSQGRTFSLTVANDAVTRIEAEYVVPGCTVKQTITGNIPLAGNSFSVSVSGTSIQGTFVSLSAASGTLTYTSSNPACSGTVNATWSATRTTPIPTTPVPSITPTRTATSTPTATLSPTAIPTPAQLTPAPLIAKEAYLPSILKLDPPPTATLPPTPTSIPPTQPPSDQRPRVSVAQAREETELRCSTGASSYLQTPQAGYTFVVVNFKVTNPTPGQTLTFSRSDVSIVASSGAMYSAQGDNFARSDSYCLGGTATFFIPSAEMSYSFVFVPHKPTIAQSYKLRFPNAEDVTFVATPK